MVSAGQTYIIHYSNTNNMANLHVIKMYCAVKSCKPDLRTWKAGKLIQARLDCIGHNLQLEQ